LGGAGVIRREKDKESGCRRKPAVDDAPLQLFEPCANAIHGLDALGARDPRSADFCFCGATSVRGRPYCNFHLGGAYAPPQRK
jgi:GcrA cell cycle regulator